MNMLLFCKKLLLVRSILFFPFCVEEGAFLFFPKTRKISSLPPKKSKKVDDVALPQPSFNTERKKKKD